LWTSRSKAAALAAATAVTSRFASIARAGSPNEKVVLALLGAGGRGTHVMQGITSLKNVETKYICDLEESRAAGAARGFAGPFKAHFPRSPRICAPCSTTKTYTAW